MIEISYVKLEKVFEYSNEVQLLVLPGYMSLPDNSEFCLTTFIADQFLIATSGLKEIEGYRRLRLGGIVNLLSENGIIKLISIETFKFKGNPRLGFEYSQGEGIKSLTAKKIRFIQGKSVVIRGGNGVGKTSTAKKIADGFENNNFKTYRLVIGQMKEDSLGEDSIIIDYSSPAEYQMKKFYWLLDKVFRDAHEGMDCCLVIDSIDAFVTLQGESEFLLVRTLGFVRRLLSLSGDFSTGSITIICTSNSYNTDLSKNINVQLKSFADTTLDFTADGKLDVSTTSY